jgi:hypothetical protein
MTDICEAVANGQMGVNAARTHLQLKELTIRALKNMRSDDAGRARRAFANYSPAAMHQEYGESGQTPAEILSAYEKHDAEITAAIAWVGGLE